MMKLYNDGDMPNQLGMYMVIPDRLEEPGEIISYIWRQLREGGYIEPDHGDQERYR